ncbi:TetR/AcrR family transcriptional regulator [Rhodococcus sp. NPDC003318]|uniref:TetR/AcrR family transcriptional regulator n=1 Tax=Rhodococcus sp. NPDC003318 TaxID=3364503 RepID=UPI0036782779
MTDGKRAYRSTLRAEQAARTRETVLDAAVRCFLRDGYTGTTMKSIAAEAGVALQTVFAQGSKAAVFLAAVDRALAADDQDRPVREGAGFVEILTGRTKEAKLDALRRVAGNRPDEEAALLCEFRSAAGGDGEIADAWTEYERRRYSDMHVLVASFEHLLRDGIDVDRATDVAWALFTIETGDRFVRGRNWTPVEYGDWMADALDRLLLR